MVSNKSAATGKKAGLGCGFTAMVGLIAIALLVINGVALDALVGDNISKNDARIVEPLQFVGSVVLIFFEFWIYDKIVGWFDSRKTKK